MYATWTEITNRDLIQKGCILSDLKDLKIDKIVLKMSLVNKESSNNTNAKSIYAKSTNSKTSQSTKKEYNKDIENSSEHVKTLSLMSLLAILSGQRPALTYARQSIANWKIRQGQLLGCKVSLRGDSAFVFLDKSIRFHNFSNSTLLKKTVNLLSHSEKEINKLNLQSLGNLSIGISNLHLYPEFESLWTQINLIFGHSKLGLDLSLNFKNTQNFLNHNLNSKLLSHKKTSIKLKNNCLNSTLYIKRLYTLRKLYLTSFGLVI